MAIFQDNRELVDRLRWLGWAFLIVGLLLFARLWFVSVARFDYYSEQARRNNVRSVTTLAPRGTIADRNGQILAENTYSFDLVFFREDREKLKGLVPFLNGHFGIAPEQVEKRIEEAARYSLYQPVVIKQGLTLDEISFLMARREDYPELEILERPQRLYPYQSLAAHVLGYVGEISRSELELETFSRHRPGDVIGKSGIERVYNANLAGRNGMRRIRVDSVGRAFEELPARPPAAGNQVRLTLDVELQKSAEQALEGYTGALVAMDPRSGEILAMASRPTFDPNDFARGLSGAAWRALSNDPGRPLQNRSIQNGFSPGSIFKIVVAVAGLESGLISPDQQYFCAGSQTLYGHEFRCASRGGHGWLRLESAIEHSCNVYFYLLGRNLGIDRISQYAHQFGLGTRTGIDLPGELGGIVPSREWKEETQGVSWYPGETISVAIGQGPLLVTPVQLAAAVGVIATGRVVKPHLLLDGKEASATGQPAPFQARSLETVRRGMWRAVNQSGTARRAQVLGFSVSGKTGTVQTISRESRERIGSQAAGRFRSNAWFVGFAPSDEPRIVIAVILEGAGSGGVVAAPAAQQVLSTFASRNDETIEAEPMLAEARNAAAGE